MADLQKQAISDNDILLRRVPITPTHIKQDGTITSAAFNLSSNDKDGLSVDVKRLTTYEASVIDENKFRLYSIAANIPRDLGLECIHNPVNGNCAHALIVRGELSKSQFKKMAKKMAKAAKLVNKF